jgi:hypothetical protein
MPCARSVLRMAAMEALSADAIRDFLRFTSNDKRGMILAQHGPLFVTA